MPITGWIAILVLIVMCYMLIKQYETRMVLFGGGFILCCISLTPMAGLNAFAKTMTNGALIMAICSATGFAYCVTFTECDRSLVHYLTRPIRNVGILMIPITSLLTFAINIAIPSAAGVGAVVGTTLIPLLLRAGFKPAAAAAALDMPCSFCYYANMACKSFSVFYAIYHVAFLYRILDFTHNLKKSL